MTLTDTGPLVALINRNDPNHAKCIAAAKRLPAGVLLTTWPCFTEAMYLLFRAAGHEGQRALWQLLATGRLALDELNAADMDRMAELMGKDRDTPIWPMHPSWLWQNVCRLDRCFRWTPTFVSTGYRTDQRSTSYHDPHTSNDE